MIPSVWFDEIYITNTYLYFASSTCVQSIARCRLTNDSWKNKRFSPFARKLLLNLVTKIYILYIIIYHHMTSYGYIIMIILDPCIIWFHLDWIMQLKWSYYIVTNVCSRISATTFCDLPDWLFIQEILMQALWHGNVVALLALRERNPRVIDGFPFQMGQKFWALTFSLLLAWTICWTKRSIAGDLRHHNADHSYTIFVSYWYQNVSNLFEK